MGLGGEKGGKFGGALNYAERRYDRLDRVVLTGKLVEQRALTLDLGGQEAAGDLYAGWSTSGDWARRSPARSGPLLAEVAISLPFVSNWRSAAPVSCSQRSASRVM